MKYIIIAARSGGHVYPAFSLAAALREQDPANEVIFFTGRTEQDKSFFTYSEWPCYTLPFRPLPKKTTSVGEALITWCGYVIGFFITLAHLIRLRPHKVIAFGGSISLIPVICARLLGIHTALHEQNVRLGRANRLLASSVDTILLGFEDSLEYEPVLNALKDKCRVTGTPIRWGTFDADRAVLLREQGLDPEVCTMLVMGGSQGAHAVNELFLQAFCAMSEECRAYFQVIHLTGQADHPWIIAATEPYRKQYVVYDYSVEMDHLYACSDCVIARAGAGTLSEIALFGLPSILIPYPFARAHQLDNAKVFFRKGAAVIIEQDKKAAEQLVQFIQECKEHPHRLDRMRQATRQLRMLDAAEKIATILSKNTI